MAGFSAGFHLFDAYVFHPMLDIVLLGWKRHKMDERLEKKVNVCPNTFCVFPFFRITNAMTCRGRVSNGFSETARHRLKIEPGTPIQLKLAARLWDSEFLVKFCETQGRFTTSNCDSLRQFCFSLPFYISEYPLKVFAEKKQRKWFAVFKF